MASVELVLAAVAAADMCLKYGKRLIGAYQTLKGANETLKAKILMIEAIWSRTAIQVKFVKQIAETLEPEHCRIHLEVFEMLHAKLATAVTRIESVMATGSEPGVKKLKFLFCRDDIDDAISELEQWRRIFDPTWYLILRMGDDAIDTELSRPLGQPGTISTDSSVTLVQSRASSLASARKLRGALRGGSDVDVHVSLNEDGLDWAKAIDIAYATTRIIPRADLKKQRVYAVDTIACIPNLDVARARADAETLAKKLAQVDPATFGLLSCNGLVKRKDTKSRQLLSINLVFQMPTKRVTSPQSLRYHLIHSSNFSLSRILGIARQLARAVSFIHTCDFVHKNIRPETILVFPDEDARPPCALGSAFLVGFDSFRSVNFRTLRAGDAAWDRNLYRHPSRQGIFTQDEYVMQHDIYSLGVCLLELGLWNSFVSYELDEGRAAGDGMPTLPSEALGLALDDFAFMADVSMQSTSKIKNRLVDIARSRLPTRMGDKYTAVVITCLTSLDQDSEDLGDEEEMKDDDGILIGVRFIERVLLKLGGISF